MILATALALTGNNAASCYGLTHRGSEKIAERGVNSLGRHREGSAPGADSSQLRSLHIGEIERISIPLRHGQVQRLGSVQHQREKRVSHRVFPSQFAGKKLLIANWSLSEFCRGTIHRLQILACRPAVSEARALSKILG